MEKIWRIKTLPPTDDGTFPEHLNISATLRALLVERGVTTAVAAERFLDPKISDLTPPEHIPGITQAIPALHRAILGDEKICVYGDYDVDGVTATVILVHTLRTLGAQVSYYIPHRYHEGYSLNHEAIDELAKQGISWMITVDCGISDIAEIDYAESKGIKVVITDHHTPPDVLPKAHAIVDPKCGDMNAPYYYLAGVGVAYKLAQALYRAFGRPLSETDRYIELVTLGTVADMVPLLGENRTITYHGLRQLTTSVWPGIIALKKTAGLKKDVSARSIGYMLGPRINAAGRLEKADIAVDLFLADTIETARPLAAQLEALNRKRQEVSARILESAEKMLADDPALLQNKVIVLTSDQWNPGVTGIAASQLVRAHYRPVVLISREGDNARGSIRSPENINIFDALKACGDLFINYGGHPEAAGFELEAKNIPAFTERYTQLLNNAITPEQLTQELRIDLPLQGPEISTELVTELQRLAPFGMDNEMPLFFSDSLTLVDFRQVGDGSHLKCTLSAGDASFDGIGFGLGRYATMLADHSGPIDLAFSLEFNEWSGKKKPQLAIQDIRLKGAAQ